MRYEAAENCILSLYSIISCWVPLIDVRIRLREVSAYRRLEMWSFGREIARGPQVGVRLQEVSVGGGLTVYKCKYLMFKAVNAENQCSTCVCVVTHSCYKCAS